LQDIVIGTWQGLELRFSRVLLAAIRGNFTCFPGSALLKLARLQLKQRSCSRIGF
jgi:hypothetical protein